MRKLIIIAAIVALPLLLIAGTAAGREEGFTTEVKVRGTERFRPNQRLYSNFRFVPGQFRVHSGDTVTWVDADGSADAPHSVTIVEEAALPVSFPDNLFCFDPGAACSTALAGHFPPNLPPVPVLEAGQPGLDAPGDSLLLLPGGSASAVVSAPAGTTLHYLCAFHPWMQGTIKVK
jgi:plastocyanin